MDSMLQSWLDSHDDAERARLFDEIILARTAPLVRRVLRQRLGVYLNPDGTNPSHPEGADLYQRILLKLIHRLRELQAAPERNPIHEYKRFVISVAINECNSHLRGKSQARTSLKNSLRMLLRRHPEFHLWKVGERRAVCGFASWEEKAPPARLARLKENPELLLSTRLAGEDPQEMPLAKLLAEIFRWLEGPIPFEDLVELVAALRKVKEPPVESIDAAEGVLADPAPRADEQLERRAQAQKLWEAIRELPLNYRRTVCLSAIGREEEEVWELLLASGVVSIESLAEGLELSIEEWMRIWLLTPLGNEALASWLGATRSQVIKWRFRALEQLRGRMGGEK